MTENEALEIIKTVNEDYFQPDNPNEFDDINESFEMAIKPLKKSNSKMILYGIWEM